MPSTADIYVNGMLVKTLTLQRANSISRIFPFPGRRQYQVIIRNAFGQQQQIKCSVLSEHAGVEGGTESIYVQLRIHQEQYGSGKLGLRATRFRRQSSSMVLRTGSLRGRFFQADDKVITGGPQLAFRTPLGQLGLWGALSGGDQAGGGSAAATYSYIATKYSFGGDITLTSKSYSTLSLTPEQDRALFQANCLY